MKYADYVFAFFMALFLTVPIYAVLFHGKPTPPAKDVIILEDQDDRGYTSIVFTEGRDTFALDYLTPFELDSFKTAHNFTK